MTGVPTKQDVLLALLSLDAYSRGENAQLAYSAGQLPNQVGTVKFVETSDYIDGAATSGFSASHYQLSSGETVIAYRGTDFVTDNLSIIETLKDVVFGWLSSFGLLEDDLGNGAIHLQPYYAQKFYEDVTKRQLFPDAGTGNDTPPQNVIITGHSLGGSLAGFIGSLSGAETVVFNEIPYLGLALTAALNTFLAPFKDIDDPQTKYQQVIKFLNGEGLSIAGLLLPQAGNVTSYRMDGEVAGYARALGPVLGFALKELIAKYTGEDDVIADAIAAAALSYGITVDGQSQVVPVSIHGGGLLDTVNLHSQALMVVTTYADSNHLVDWYPLGDNLLKYFFDNDVAIATGASELGGYGGAPAKMLDAIAYSVLDEGTLVFGNTGVRALFDDADALGALVSSGKVSRVLRGSLDGLTEAIVQFAGSMAVRQVNYHDYESPSSPFHPEQGILDLSDSDGKLTSDPASAALLTLNVNQDLWSLGRPSDQLGIVDILGVQDLIASMVERAEGTVGRDLIADAMQKLYRNNNSSNPFSITEVIGSVQFSLSESPLILALADKKDGYDGYHASVFVATDGDDIIDGNGQNNIIAGSNGDDTLVGHLGSDLLIGGNGSDLFIDSVTEKDKATGRQNENDIYIGRDQTVGLVTNFVDWLMNGTETDTVRYTIDPLTVDDYNTPEDESALQQEGVTITHLKKTKLGQTEALEITVRNDKSGREGTDLLVSIDKIELSDRPDHLEIDDDALDAPILIDMGKSGRLASELPLGEKPGANDFIEKVDVADYSKVSHGLVYLNGVTSAHSEVGSLDNVFQWNGFDQELLTLSDYIAKGALGYNDTLHVTGADRIELTDHDDVVMSADYGSIIETGAGNDKIWFMDGVAVSDLSADDRIALAGVLTLYGGLRNEASENPYAWGPYGTSYGFNAQGDLIIRNAFWHVKTQNAAGGTSDDVATMYVLNWKDSATKLSNGGELGAGGIFIAQYHISAVTFRDLTLDMKGQYSVMGEGLFEILGMQIKTLTGHDSVWGGEDPLVLDLDGDGIELTAIDYTKPRFDGDDDLYAEASGFVSKDDGILVRDLDGDGKITSSAEMFGKGLTSGFSILATLDGNHDGVIDSHDNGLADFDGDGDIDANDTFDRLLVWQDANENHTTDTGELKSVTARGITSISVTPTQLTQPQSINGNTITSTASFTMQDGTVRTIADVLLHLENQNTTYVGPAIAVSSSVADIADLKGRGTLVSLHQALSYSPAAEAAVRAAIPGMASPDLSALRISIMPILTAWAAGSPVKINGVITSGASALSTYDDLTIVRKNGDIVDYAWGLSTADGQDAIAGIQMASGVVIATNGTINSRRDLKGLLDHWTSAGSVATVTTGQETLSDGSSVSYLDYRSGSDYLRIYNYGKAAWSRELSAANPSIASDVSLGTVSGSDFAFYERFLGESLQPFFEKPASATAAYAAVTTFLDKMDDVLNLFAVRLAVQSGPLSKYFGSIQYNAETDNFVSRSGNQIAAVFSDFLEDAEKTSDAAGWLAGWKQFFDVFLADYSRGNAAQQNSYAFLVQNMMNAVDQNAGGVTVQQFAHAFGIPDSLIVAGSGAFAGTNGDDIILVDGDDTAVSGGNGADNYIVGRNFNSVTISDDDGPLGSAVDTLRFSAHKASDLSVSRDGKDLLLTDTISGQTVRIINQFFGRWPGATIGNAWDDWGVAQIVFADGTVWTKVEIAEAVSKIDDASTHIVGTADVDVLQGGKGDDLLEGGGDTDIYRIGRGDGRDIIHDFEDNAFRNDQDMLQFLDGIKINDLIFQRDGASNDLVIKFKNDDVDQVTIQGQFAATYTGVYGTWYMERIDLFTFDNGTSLTSDQVAQLVLQTYSTDGNDSLYGFNREDILHAGKGDDFISGGNQSDLYLYSRGDGNDVIQDGNTNFLSGSDDYLRFGIGITWSDLSFGRVEGDYNSVVLYINGNQGSVTLKNEYGYAATGVFGNVFFDRIEEIQFADGSPSVDSYELAARVLASQKTSGDDIIQGFDIDDVLDGGAGDDFLYGNNGDDTYVWGRGYGNDTIQDRNGSILAGGDHDKIVFSGYVTPNDIRLSRDPNAIDDLIFTLVDTGETLRLVNQYWYTTINYHPDQIDEIHFSDGTVWNTFQAMHAYLNGAKTAGDDTIYGIWADDTLDGGAGNDILRGGDGSDTYIFGYGYGNDTIDEEWRNVFYADDDAVQFLDNVKVSDVTFSRVGDYDLLLTLAGSSDTLLIKNQFLENVWDMTDIERFVFSDGTTITKTQVMRNLLTSTAADDTLVGFVYNDTFTYRRGGGNDTIVDYAWNGNEDELVLADINPAEVKLVRNGSDIKVVVLESAPGAGDAGSIVLKNSVNDNNHEGIEKMTFADGTSWSIDQIRALLLAQMSTDGNDTIIGMNVADTIAGGRGDDFMNGGGGNDTYVYARGDGNDTIQEDYYSGYNDRLVFTNINLGDISLTHNENDVTILIKESAPSAGDGGSILLKGELNIDIWHTTGVETIVFADGTTWGNVDLLAKLLTPTNGDDNLIGFVTDDTIVGGHGNDFMNGVAGNDTYVYARGDGNDTIQEDYARGGNDRLVFTDINAGDVMLTHNGTDVTLVIKESAPGTGDGGSILLKSEMDIDIWHTTGVEAIVFADGTTWSNVDLAAKLLVATAGDDSLIGFVTNDTITGGHGNDFMNGGNGNDTYVYARGDGNDTIQEDYASGGNDRLVFTDINAGDVLLVRDGNSVKIVIKESAVGAGDGGMITLKSELDIDIWRTTGVEQIIFADGTAWQNGDLAAKILTQANPDNDDIVGFGGNDVIDAGDGNDIVHAGNGDDTITGGRGDDRLFGEGGSDTYSYRKGDGNDIIVENATGNERDRLVLSDLGRADTRFTIDETGLVLSFAPSGSVALRGTGVSEVQFADGSIVNYAEIAAEAIANMATAGADVIGSVPTPFRLSNVAVDLRKGDDTLYADGVGQVTVNYGSGDGNDTYRLKTSSGQSTSILKLHQIAVSDISYAATTTNDLIIRFASTGQSIAVTGQLQSNEFGFASIILDDGTVVSRNSFQQVSSYIGTAGDDVLGTQANPFRVSNVSVNLGLGNDKFYADYVAGDIVQYARGDGNDVYRFWNNASSTTSLRLAGIDAGDLDFLRNNNDLQIVDRSTGQTITFTDQFAGDNFGINRIVLDQSELSRADFSAQVWYRGTSGSDVFGTQSSPFTIANAKIELGRGDDTFYGDWLQNATLRYNHGDGNDTYRLWNGSASVSTLVFSDLKVSDLDVLRSGDAMVLTDIGNGQSVTITGQFTNNSYGFGTFRFSDGATLSREGIAALAWIKGTSGNDVLGTQSSPFSTANAKIDLGGGNDTFYGNGVANATIRYRHGDGNDIYRLWNGVASVSTLVLSDLLTSNITLSRSGDALVLTDRGNGQTISITSQLSGSNYGFGYFRFADDTVWTSSDAAVVLALQDAAAGNDTINGTGAADTLAGGKGDDILNGAAGDDTYVYARGDGNDTITEDTWNGYNDVVRFTDLNPSDVRLGRN
ncbi:calcium-binding protein, partial [Rhizobium sp.]|uniref:calcium-binding protein n=1 Tax=Rhizobium sp. TaxID=391 RepID=UPI003F7E7D0E